MAFCTPFLATPIGVAQTSNFIVDILMFSKSMQKGMDCGGWAPSFFSSLQPYGYRIDGGHAAVNDLITAGSNGLQIIITFRDLLDQRPPILLSILLRYSSSFCHFFFLFLLETNRKSQKRHLLFSFIFHVS